MLYLTRKSMGVGMKSKVKLLHDLYEERDILKKNLNLYYFDREKRDRFFIRLERIEKEIERVEKDGFTRNKDTDRTTFKEK